MKYKYYYTFHLSRLSSMFNGQTNRKTVATQYFYFVFRLRNPKIYMYRLDTWQPLGLGTY